MFKKVKGFLKGKKQLEQPAQPEVDVTTVNQNDKKVENKEIDKKSIIDEDVLRYLVTGAENFVSSTAIKERWCYYIFVKPGMMEDLMKVSNIDVVQAVYAEHGINTRKHISHLDGKEQEILYIPSSEVAEYDNDKLTFLRHTAPAHFDDAVSKRKVELINKVYRSKGVKTKLGTYTIEER